MKNKEHRREKQKISIGQGHPVKLVWHKEQGTKYSAQSYIYYVSNVSSHAEHYQETQKLSKFLVCLCGTLHSSNSIVVQKVTSTCGRKPGKSKCTKSLIQKIIMLNSNNQSICRNVFHQPNFNLILLVKYKVIKQMVRRDTLHLLNQKMFKITSNSVGKGVETHIFVHY